MMDCSMTYGGPVYVTVAVALILAVALVYFAAVLPLVRLRNSALTLTHDLPLIVTLASTLARPWRSTQSDEYLRLCHDGRTIALDSIPLSGQIVANPGAQLSQIVVQLVSQSCSHPVTARMCTCYQKSTSCLRSILYPRRRAHNPPEPTHA